MRILFVGCGNMGLVIAQGMLDSGKFDKSQIDVVLPQGSKSASKVVSQLHVNVASEYPAGGVYDLVLFAVKPQVLPDILPYYQSKIKNTSTLIASIAAGKTIGYFEKHFPHSPIIRAMPNINVSVHAGVTGMIANSASTTNHKQLLDSIFGALGYTVWVQEEKLINTIIAIAASSPAYLFQFAEYLAEAGVEEGLSEDIALKLAEQTFIGSAKMLAESGKSLQQLRAMVTSPGGTTLAALNAFNKDDQLYQLIKGAVHAAIKRSNELSE